jgi:hypothetical protein
MSNRYYLSEAFDVDGYGQSDELYLLEHNGRVFGYSAEFELCTFDIEKASSTETINAAIWFGDDQNWEFKPASFALLKKFELTQYLIGSRKRMHSHERIEPITDLDDID